MYTNLSTCFSQIQCLVLCVCVCVCVCVWYWQNSINIYRFYNYFCVWGKKMKFIKLFFLFQILIPVILMHSRIHDPQTLEFISGIKLFDLYISKYGNNLANTMNTLQPVLFLISLKFNLC